MSIDSSTACARCEPPMKFCVCGVRHEVQRLIDYYSSEAVEAMRDACIASLEALVAESLMDECAAYEGYVRAALYDAIDTVREVQP